MPGTAVGPVFKVAVSQETGHSDVNGIEIRVLMPEESVGQVSELSNLMRGERRNADRRN